MSKSSKQKLMEKFGEVGNFEKVNHKVGFTVNMEKKVIDGNEKLAMVCDLHTGPSCIDVSVPEIQPYRREYTNKSEFVDYLRDLIDNLEKQI